MYHISPPLRKLIFFFAFLPCLTAQDYAFDHFYSLESAFNPAYVGFGGATIVSAKYRRQWGGNNIAPYVGMQASIEETLPCTLFDFGLFASEDTEGEGVLTTLEAGLRAALSIPLKETLNLRIGFGLTFGQRSIDLDKLVFLDQLDPLYGRFNREGELNPTAYQNLSANPSALYSSPSIGLLFTGVTSSRNKRALSYEVGLAVHHPDALISADSRQNASLNGLDNPLGERWTASIRVEKPLKVTKTDYVSIRPAIIYQTVADLSYLEVGTSVGLSRNLIAGLYYHSAVDKQIAPASNWLSLQLEVGGRVSDYSRVDIGFAYSIPLG